MAPEESKFVILDMAGQLYAVPVEAVQEIVPMAALSRFPGQPSLLEGFLNLRGAAVPVVRTDRLLDIPGAEPGLDSPLVIIRGESWPLALLVDRVVEIGSPEQILPLQANSSVNDCAEAEALFAGRATYILNCGKILLEKERRCIAALRENAQERLERLESCRYETA